MSGSSFRTDSPWTCWGNKLYSTVFECPPRCALRPWILIFPIINPKGNQPWIFTGRTDAEAPILWLPDVKSWLTGKDPDSGKDGRQAEKRMRWLDVITDLMDRSFEQVPEMVKGREPCLLQSIGLPRVRQDWDLTTTHSRILAWEIPWTQEPGGLQSLGFSKRSDWALRPFYVSLILMLIQVTSITENNLLKWISLLPCSYKSKKHSNTPNTREGNGTPLLCSCLENPRDGGAWWAAVSGVAESRTRLKRRSSSNTRERTSAPASVAKLKF